MDVVEGTRGSIGSWTVGGCLFRRFGSTSRMVPEFVVDKGRFWEGWRTSYGTVQGRYYAWNGA